MSKQHKLKDLFRRANEVTTYYELDKLVTEKYVWKGHLRTEMADHIFSKHRRLGRMSKRCRECKRLSSLELKFDETVGESLIQAKLRVFSETSK